MWSKVKSYLRKVKARTTAGTEIHFEKEENI
jgi:hypothetical protein